MNYQGPGGRKEWRVTTNGYGVCFDNAEHILDIDGNNGYTLLQDIRFYIKKEKVSQLPNNREYCLT